MMDNNMMMNKMGGKKVVHTIAFILLIIGGLNWLLVGIFQWEIGFIFGGPGAVISRIIYILVGLSAIYLLITHKSCCGMCGMMKMGMMDKGMGMNKGMGMDKDMKMMDKDMGMKDSMGMKDNMKKM